jgi:nitrate reductase assembly molybdenum cofactor insertion protein NarJ
MLRFFSVAQDAEFVIPLLEESILPVLDKMAGDLQKNKNGYSPAVSSLRLLLRQLSRRLTKVGGLA